MAENIEQFELYTARLLARLYQNFPVPVAIDLHEIVYNAPSGLSDLDHKADRDRYIELYNAVGRDEKVKFAVHTVRWLLETQYFKGRLYDGDIIVYVSHAVLTPKAFEALAAVPEPLVRREPLGDQLVEFSQRAGAEGLERGIGEIIGQVIGIATRGLILGV